MKGDKTIGRYAEHTRVPAGRSRDEIERTLVRYGADEFFYGNSSRGAGVGFKYKERVVKYSVPLPKRTDFKETKTGEQNWERECRRLWRVLLLAIKAKLELVDSGLTTFEDEFLAQTCLPSGQTVAEWIQPQIDKSIDVGKMPKLLLAGKEIRK